MKKLKEELEDERKANAMAAIKLSESLELVRKMEGVAQQPAEILNKAKLFDEGLAKNPVTAAKVILVLVDFNQKMEELLLDMRALFDGLEVEGLVPWNQVSNISINTEELSTLQGWKSGTVGQTPTPTKPATTPKPTPKDTQEKGEPARQLELESVPTPKTSRSTPHIPCDDMAATTRQILATNPDIADRIMEHMRTQPFIPLRPEDLVPLLVGEQRRAVEVES